VFVIIQFRIVSFFHRSRKWTGFLKAALLFIVKKKNNHCRSPYVSHNTVTYLRWTEAARPNAVQATGFRIGFFTPFDKSRYSLLVPAKFVRNFGFLTDFCRIGSREFSNNQSNNLTTSSTNGVSISCYCFLESQKRAAREEQFRFRVAVLKFFFSRTDIRRHGSSSHFKVCVAINPTVPNCTQHIIDC